MNYNNMFEFELRKLVEEEILRVTEVLTTPGAIVDLSDYRHQVGKIVALRGVLDLCDEANSILSKR